MEQFTKKLCHIIVSGFAMICVATTLSAADAVIHGVVTSTAGKPVRGAIVKATAGTLSVSAYSQNDGRYAITIPAGSVEVSADAFGIIVDGQDNVWFSDFMGHKLVVVS